MNLLASIAAAAVPGDLRPLKPPVALPLPWTVWLVLILLLLAAAGLAVWLWRRSHRPVPPPPPEPPIPAHERALEKLRDALALIDQPHPFTVRICDTIRTYLEERFHLHAPERTTEEFLLELRHSASLETEHKSVLGDFLQRCDLIKFARYEPGRHELDEIYRAAVRLVEETAPAPLPVPGSTAATAPA
ncbi:MAG: hypothetical protein KA118_05895 [Verrucomicrobia bacterium]|nr:hypothetical protein [Verrucomicrobiota bacterium]